MVSIETAAPSDDST